jgi:GNAT superfamily N-acetyltransferase
MAKIRPAVAAEATLLSELALRSKGHWGYDADFIEACREDLTVTADFIVSHSVFVLEADEQVKGFYGLRGQNREVELVYLFLEPDQIGQGYGKQLWQHAIATAREQNFTSMLIESEPHAEHFYLAMGARRVGERLSTVRLDRRLPLLQYSLALSVAT